jgi:hypothetical protein
LGAFAASDGRRLWETEYLPDLQDGPGEIYIRDGVAWIGPLFDKPRDLRTGQIKADRRIVDQLWTEGHHYRCYIGKATSNYIITAKRGVEMIDLNGDRHSRNNWVRGTCQVGVTPCNGMLYAPPHSCGCYMAAKLFGFWALAGPREDWDRMWEDAASQAEKGPAYTPRQRANPPATGRGWWTYRGGSPRGGSSVAKVGTDLTQRWKAELGGHLTAATAVDGRVFVAQRDAHTLHALDSKTGRREWAFTAGGRIDSPPTVVGPRVFFGCRAGCVYCLRASDGALVWRFRVAPARMQAVAFDQLESVWPVHGSVLYQSGTVYAAAGRSSYLDGGIRIVALDPVSGTLRSERRVRNEHAGALAPPPNAKTMDRRNKQNWKDYKTDLAPDRSDSFAMSGARPAILVGAHNSVYMRHKRFSSTLEEMPQRLPHLFSTSELLDGWEHNRTYWALGTGDFSGLPVAYPWLIKKAINVPIGVMMAFDDRTIWTVVRGKRGYQIIARQRPGKESVADSLPDFQGKRNDYKTLWTAGLAMRPRSIVRAGDLLLVGGLPKGQEGNPFAVAREAKQGQQGCLQLLSARDGKTVGELKLNSPPVWDGMAAADRALFIPCVDGTVISLSGTVSQ